MKRPAPTRSASPGKRLFAFLIDASMQAILLMVMAAIFTDLAFSERALVAGLLTVSAAYSIGFVGFTSSTPGKMAMGMWVSDGTDQRVLPDRAILRFLVLALPNLTLLGVLRDHVQVSLAAWAATSLALLLVNAALILRDPARRLLHDRISGTMVVEGRPPELT